MRATETEKEVQRKRDEGRHKAINHCREQKQEPTRASDEQENISLSPSFYLYLCIYLLPFPLYIYLWQSKVLLKVLDGLLACWSPTHLLDIAETCLFVPVLQRYLAFRHELDVLLCRTQRSTTAIERCVHTRMPVQEQEGERSRGKRGGGVTTRKLNSSAHMRATRNRQQQAMQNGKKNDTDEEERS